MDVTALVLVLAALGLGQLAYGRLRLLPGAPGHGADHDRGAGARGADDGESPLTIVVPARNEALSLPLLLADLEVHRPPGCRVIVVDDHSDDGTAELAAAHPFVDVRRAPPLPAGWTGKTWACHTGAAAIDRGVVIFLDADVRLSAGAIDAVAAEVARTGGLVSVQPFHVVVRPSERVSALFGVVAVMGSRAGHHRPTGAFGPVLATTVADYRFVGGHAAVSDEVVEDLALARRYRESALGVSVHAGGDRIRYRMYPAGFGSLVEGWSKNIATGARSTAFTSLVGVVAWVTALCTITLALARVGPLGDASLLVTGIAYAAVVVQLAVMFRRVGAFGWGTALAFPVLVMCFVAVFARSIYLGTIRGSVRWRGRDIAVGRSTQAFTR